MYNRNELQSMSSFSTIMRILKKNPEFNRYCTQHRIAKGTVFLTENPVKFSYLIESGYLQYSYVGDFAKGYYFFIKPGKFFSFPFFQDQPPSNAELTAITEVIWWKIDFEFLRKVLLLEDPKNFIMLNYVIDTAMNLYMMTKKYLSSSENRIYFCLLKAVEAGIRVGENEVELPLFLTYDRLAYIANSSKGYTASILTALREEGILVATKKPWIIKDVARLKEKLGIIDTSSI